MKTKLSSENTPVFSESPSTKPLQSAKMAWTKYQSFVVVLLIVTGSMNTIATKWANISEAVGSDGKGPRSFAHPFLQTCFMFLGQLLCMVAFKILYFYYWKKQDGSEDKLKLVKGNRTFNPLVLLPPAICDMIAGSIMYIALILTYAASFQMLRGSSLEDLFIVNIFCITGAVIVFVGLFSMCFLKRKLGLQEWGGIFLVILGLGLVGLSDFLSPGYKLIAQHYSTKEIIIGDLLIVLAQVVSAMHMVLEEKFVAELDIPALQASGWEGIFGLSILGFLLIPFYFIPVPGSFSGNPRNVLEDAVDGFVQMYNNQVILVACLASIVSIAFFNFAGISVTKELSATTRKVLDSIRTFFIWMFSLGMGWQKFYWLKIIGFMLLVTGTLVYSRAFSGVRRFSHKKRVQETSTEQKALPSVADEETEDSRIHKEIDYSPDNKPQEKLSS